MTDLKHNEQTSFYSGGKLRGMLQEATNPFKELSHNGVGTSVPPLELRLNLFTNLRERDYRTK